jgi:hypothetical protein
VRDCHRKGQGRFKDELQRDVEDTLRHCRFKRYGRKRRMIEVYNAP